MARRLLSGLCEQRSRIEPRELSLVAVHGQARAVGTRHEGWRSHQ